MSRFTPNQVVAYNLRRAREVRGLTQEEAAARLAPALGDQWSVASWSSAERSVTGKRVRNFTADELLAFSRAFDLPVQWFFTPPPPDDHPADLIAPPDADEGFTPDELSALVEGHRGDTTELQALVAGLMTREADEFGALAGRIEEAASFLYRMDQMTREIKLRWPEGARDATEIRVQLERTGEAGPTKESD